jgi:hypothetical protein
VADDAAKGRVLGEEMHCGVVEAFDRVLHFLMGCGSQGTCMVRK